MQLQEHQTTLADPPAVDDPIVRRLIKERFYQWAMDEAGGNSERPNWPRAAEAIERYTGFRIDHETLRKNFRASSKRQGRPPNQFRDKATWVALYRFLTSDAVAYLSPVELPTAPFTYAAFAGLQGFLDPLNESVFPHSLIGRFDNFSRGQEMGQPLVIVDFLGPAAAGPARVEVRELEDADEDEGACERTSFSGGVVHSARGYLAAFVREAVSKELRTLIVLQTRPSLTEERSVVDIAVLRVSGLSPKQLVRSDTQASVEVAPTLHFDGVPDIVLLTRC